MGEFLGAAVERVERPRSSSASMAASRKATFLPVASISVARSPGAMTASARPGRPAPDPMSTSRAPFNST